MSEKADKSNDFFNLASSDDDDLEEINGAEKKRAEEEGIKKWDWDRPENFSLYFSAHSATSSKRGIDESNEIHAKRICSTSIRTERTPRIQLNDSCIRMELIGHEKSVNRVHWAKREQMSSMLLSSSFDG